MNQQKCFNYELFKLSKCFVISLIILMLSVFFSKGSIVNAEENIDLLESDNDYTAILYDNTNGLPTSEANAIVQSEDGYIWLGGYSGLIRYDGNTFYRYDSSTGIATVRCLCMDSKGRLWIGTNDDGVAMLKDEKFVFYNKGKGLEASSIRSIVEDDNGNIVIVTTMGIAVVDKDDNIKSLSTT